MKSPFRRDLRRRAAAAAIVALLVTACASGGGAGGERGATPDPAVAHANQVAAGAERYVEGYFGDGDRRLHYVEAGGGDLVIFYHGFPSFWLSFFDQMEALKGRYRVVAVDGLGAGLSAKPDSLDAYRIDKLAADIDALARHFAGDQPFILIGHDWGAALAFAFAQAYPERLAKVVGLSAPPYELFLEMLEESAVQQRASGYMREITATTTEAVIADPPGQRLFEIGYAGLVRSGALSHAEGELFRAALAPAAASNGGYNWYRANIPSSDEKATSMSWPAPGARIAVPALLVWGETDRTFDAAFIERLESRSDRLTIEVISGVGHWTPIERPEAAAEAIRRFLESEAS